MMYIETITINLRNIFLFELLVALACAGNSPIIHQELIKIWKSLKAPFLLNIKPTRTNHKSNKFWEIDMTKLEP
jgi:hypothetical protein